MSYTKSPEEHRLAKLSEIDYSLEIPTPLPRGITEFYAWADDLIALAGVPNNDSVKFALAVSITHLGPTESNKSKKHFIDVLQKGAATQIAFAIMDELKSKQQAAKDEAAKAALEATKETVASNVVA